MRCGCGILARSRAKSVAKYSTIELRKVARNWICCGKPKLYMEWTLGQLQDLPVFYELKASNFLKLSEEVNFIAFVTQYLTLIWQFICILWKLIQI